MEGRDADHVDHVTDDLAGFLSRIEGALAGEQEHRRKARVAASAQDSAIEAGQGCAASVTPRLKHNRPAE
jgi:hypothetical protein